MNSENDDRETLLPIKSLKSNYKPSEPFGIEGAVLNPDERPLPVPSFITQQKTLYEKSKFLRILCCCSKKKYRDVLISNINNHELAVYYKLKYLASQLFDENNSQHKESLKLLYLTCIDKDMTENLRTIEWKTVGFQVNIL